MAKKKLLISFSGGRTSAYMLWWLWNNKQDEFDMTVVFANTGLEVSGTLEFVHRVETEWKIPIVWVESRHRDKDGNLFSERGWGIRHQVVSYETAAKFPKKNPVTEKWSWTPFEEMISALGIPTTNAPFCSEQLKTRAIKSYMSSIKWKGHYVAIGIRSDESSRISNKKKYVYPLATENPMKKLEILSWWASQDFDLDIHEDDGNCNNCWKKNMNLLMRNASRDPEGFEWWQYITDTYGHLNPRNIDFELPFNFYRGNLSPKDIIDLAAGELNENKKRSLMKQLEFEFYTDSKCGESCEAF